MKIVIKSFSHYNRPHALNVDKYILDLVVYGMIDEFSNDACNFIPFRHIYDMEELDHVSSTDSQVVKPGLVAPKIGPPELVASVCTFS